MQNPITVDRKITLKNFSLLVLFSIIIRVSSFAQSNEGTLFWMSFMEHRDIGNNTMVAMITSKVNTTGSIFFANTNFAQSYTVNANQVTLINLPRQAEVTGSETIQNKGVKISSRDPVSVYIHQYANARSEAASILPVASLGTEYYTMSYNGYADNNGVYPSEFIVVGTQDNTTVNINVTDNTKGGKAKNSAFDIILNEGEVYQVQARAGLEDLTGSKIVSDKKIAVLSGARWIGVPENCTTRDNLLEMMAPVTTWGRQFISAPSAKASYDVFRILASEDNTLVEVVGTQTQTYTLQKAEFIQFNSSEAKYIKSNKAIQVAQYLIGQNCNGFAPNGDPSMLLLNSIEQRRDTVTLYNSSFQNIVENYISLIMNTDDIATVIFDGQPLASVAQITTVVGNPRYSYAIAKVNAGAHTITAKGCGVTAAAYGYGNAESYAYGGGASFKNINFNPLPAGGCVSTKILFDTQLDSSRYLHTWKFEDGTTTKIAKFEKVFTVVDTLGVSLLIEDKCLGTIDSFYKDMIISVRKAVVTSPKVEVCEKETIQLSAADIAKAEYKWTGPNEFFSEEQNPFIVNVSSKNNGIYSVIGSFFGCPTEPAKVEVRIKPLPKPFIGRDTFYCERKGSLDISVSEVFPQYEWNTGATSKAITITKKGNYNVTVTDNEGCLKDTSINIASFCPSEIYIADAFYPNSINQSNRTFTIVEYDVISSDFKVFDRWGGVIYNVKNNEKPWDGISNGKEAAAGMYPYIYSYEGLNENGTKVNKIITGQISLFR